MRRLGRRLWMVPHRRSRVLREARDHLLAATESGLARGLSLSDAEAQAVARFGPAGRIARHEIREAGALWASVVAGLAAVTVSLMVLASRADVHPLFDYHAGNYGSLQNVQPSNSNQPYQFQPWAISAASQSDAWIVGAPARVAWHWNGATWEKVAMAPPPRDYPRYRRRLHHPGPVRSRVHRRRYTGARRRVGGRLGGATERPRHRLSHLAADRALERPCLARLAQPSNPRAN